jgi:prevent-host-death family protein
LPKGLLRQVGDTREPVIVTLRGQPVVMIVPADPEDDRKAIKVKKKKTPQTV